MKRNMEIIGKEAGQDGELGNAEKTGLLDDLLLMLHSLALTVDVAKSRSYAKEREKEREDVRERGNTRSINS